MQSPLKGETTIPRGPCANVTSTLAPAPRSTKGLIGRAGRRSPRGNVRAFSWLLKWPLSRDWVRAWLQLVQGNDYCFSALNSSQVIMENHAPGTEGRTRRLHRFLIRPAGMRAGRGWSHHRPRSYLLPQHTHKLQRASAVRYKPPHDFIFITMLFICSFIYFLVLAMGVSASVLAPRSIVRVFHLHYSFWYGNGDICRNKSTQNGEKVTIQIRCMSQHF